jgi:DNA polymerase/3'-5' exonuclease PolX
MTNADIARKLREHAAELSRQGGNLYRVRAFRQAAFAVSGLPKEVADVVAAAGADGLRAVPGIGDSLAGTIADYAVKGVWSPRTPPRTVRNESPGGPLSATRRDVARQTASNPLSG